MATELHLELLGGLRITGGEAALPGLATHKGQALLCYLALTRRPHTRDTLASLLWSDDPQEEARASLRNVLSLVRKAASPYLVVTRDTIAFNHQGQYWLDVDMFRDKFAASAGTTAKSTAGANTASANEDQDILLALREAMDLYRGELLEGFYVPGAALFEEWVLTERQLLHGMAIEALHRLSSECIRQGDTAGTQQAITYLNRLLVLEPWREEARRDLMRLLAETGQRSAALSEYETCRRILLAELGVEPGEETVALYKQILAGDIGSRAPEIARSVPKSAPKPPNNLPAALTPLFGRDMELTQLTDRLQRPDLRLLTLVGEGGIGKTRLATELASRLLLNFPDGVFFVSLSALRDAELVPSSIAQALKLQEGEGRSYLDALKEWLAERKVLLVLDNFEQILDATGTVIELLRAAPNLNVLVTSREPLATIGEHVFPVPPLSVPDPLHVPALESLDQYSSIALFCARAEAVRFGFALTADNAVSVVDICKRLDGSPLAIELAAAQTGRFEVDEIARRLNDRFVLLAKGNRAAPDRHQTLRACIEWSYDLLTEQDRRLFRLLSVFVGGWTMEAAVAVCEQEDITEGTQRLVDKSLVILDPKAGRYGMHESIRQYAAEKLEEAGEVEAMRALHLNYVTELAEAAEQYFSGPDAADWLDKIEVELDNLRGAFDWLQDRTRIPDKNVARDLRLVGALWPFWLMRGYIEEGGSRLEAALAANGAVEAHLSEPEPSSSQLLIAWSKALTGAGVMAEARGEYDVSRGYLERNLAVRRALGDKKGIAWALHNLAQAVKGEGDVARARQLTEESLAIKRNLGDKGGIATSLSGLGSIAYHQGDYAAACAFYEESIALARELQKLNTLANSISNLGGVLLAMGEHHSAKALLEESLALARELGDRSVIGDALGGLGQLAADQGDYAHALYLQKESLEQYRQAGHFREISKNLADSALAVGALGHAEEAARLMGASEAARVATRYQLTPADKVRIERGLARMRSETEIDPNRLEAAYKEGLAMTLEQAIAAALEAAALGSASIPATAPLSTLDKTS